MKRNTFRGLTALFLFILALFFSLPFGMYTAAAATSQCLVHADKVGYSAYVPLNNLFQSYRHVLEAAMFPISLLIICEDKYRAAEFNAVFSHSPYKGKVKFSTETINFIYS